MAVLETKKPPLGATGPDRHAVKVGPIGVSATTPPPTSGSF